MIPLAFLSTLNETDHIMRLAPRIILPLALLAAQVSALAADIVKAPDLNTYWNPLSNLGSYTYANSFVPTSNGTVSGLGLWLKGGVTDLQLKVFDSLDGNLAFGPDSAAVLATSGIIPGQAYDTLTFVGVNSGINSAQLVAGHTYWFAATTIGLMGSGGYTVGGHTQNSGGIVDNGSFWFTNDLNGVSFGGPRTPEMAFRVSVGVIPEPASYAMLGLGLGVLAAFGARLRRRP